MLLCVALLGLPAVPAAAQTCPPAGGADVPAGAHVDADFSFSGRGWGHGAGMSQYGARGAARLGCTAEQILTTYYTNVTVGSADTPSAMRVGLFEAAETINVRAEDGTVRWEVCDAGTCSALPEQPEGSMWNLGQAAGGTQQVLRNGGPDGEELWRGGSATALVRADFDGTTIFLTSTSHRYRRGHLDFQPKGNGLDEMTVVVEVPGMEAYLYGLAEVPSSWEVEALEAQAIAARSYALQRHLAFAGNRPGCRCDVYATVRDQAYSGWDKEADELGARWVAAVNATAGRVVQYQGRVIEGYYSSSHGGYSESARFVFGGELPYIQPVDDTRWDLASDNPYRTWAAGVSAEQLGAAAGVGTATGVALPDPKGFGGRVGAPDRDYGGVVVTGTAGEQTLSGGALRSALGLRSTNFTVQARPSAAHGAAVSRVSAGDRIGTAVAVSAAHWDTAGDAVMATAGAYADALAGGALAARLGAPLLLTESTVLSPAVGAELDRLGVRTVWLLGGQAVLSPLVEQQLVAQGYRVHRLAGENRFATAAAVAREVGAADGVVTLTLGEDWPDAVASGALAATPAHVPALLTSRRTLAAEARDALAELGVRQVTVVGGEASVAPAVVDELRALGYGVERLAGPSRYGTSIAVVEAALARVAGQETPVVFASGQNYPDALSAAALAARLGGTLVLVPRDDLDDAPPVPALLRERAGRLGKGVVVGGTSAVSEQVRQQLATLLQE